MSTKAELRKQRNGTIVNGVSFRQEKQLKNAVLSVINTLHEKFPGIQLKWEQEVKLQTVINRLKISFPDVSFATPLPASAMKPDGGFLYMIGKDGELYPILITEKKNQGTNDIRLQEGKKKQSMGNAIERLGKNVIGLCASMLTESIFPFVCFGDGCDFADGSSILDRVVTIAMFGELNEAHLFNQKAFARGSFYFRRAQWSEEEMFRLSCETAIRSVYYYFGKYGDKYFLAGSLSDACSSAVC